MRNTWPAVAKSSDTAFQLMRCCDSETSRSAGNVAASVAILATSINSTSNLDSTRSNPLRMDSGTSSVSFVEASIAANAFSKLYENTVIGDIFDDTGKA